METIVGEITVVQEGRFRLATGDGRSLLFVLARRAPLEPQDLDGLIGRPVQVHYIAAEGRIAALAQDLTVPPGQGPASSEEKS